MKMKHILTYILMIICFNVCMTLILIYIYPNYMGSLDIYGWMLVYVFLTVLLLLLTLPSYWLICRLESGEAHTGLHQVETGDMESCQQQAFSSPLEEYLRRMGMGYTPPLVDLDTMQYLTLCDRRISNLSPDLTICYELRSDSIQVVG